MPAVETFPFQVVSGAPSRARPSGCQEGLAGAPRLPEGPRHGWAARPPAGTAAPPGFGDRPLSVLF